MTNSKIDQTEPYIRFPCFSGEWQLTSLGENLVQHQERISAPSPLPVYSSTRTGLKLQKEYYDDREVTNEGEYGVVPEGYFVYRHMSDDNTFKFNINYTGSKVAVSKEYPVFTTLGLNSDFLLLKLNYGSDFQRFAAMQKLGGTRTRLYFNKLCSWKTQLPDEDEQQKIAAFLTSVDKKLNKLRRKQELLETYKRGLMQKIFSQEICFKQDNGSDFPDWEEKKLGDIFERVTRKNSENNTNVLTISAQHGLINQEKYFNKSVSAQDVTGYYLLETDNFAYNKSYSKGYPMGAIKRLKSYDKGVVSTLYICFKNKKKEETNFYEHYFDAGLLNKELHKIAQEGARNHGLLNLSVVEFFRDINIMRPHPDEQDKISLVLTAMNEKLSVESQRITRLESFKKALLQKMFV